MTRPLTQTLLYDLSASVKTILQTLLVCCILYTLIIWVIGQVLMPNKAEGSLILNSTGVIIGSQLIAQNFRDPGYFWSRPSAVNYNAAGSGGSNLSPTNPALRQRIRESFVRLQPGAKTYVPADMVMTSGSGLDPHITMEAALFQVERIARARQSDPQAVRVLIPQATTKANPFFGKPSLVNVLELNLLLDKELPYKPNEQITR